MQLFIKVGSITNAQRASSVLRSHGYKPQIKRIENPTKNDGCGYGIAVSSNSREPIEILEKNSVRIRGVEGVDLS